MLETLQQWDKELFLFLNNLGIERYDGFWLFVTRIESWIWLFVLFFILIFKAMKRRRALFASGFVLLTLGLAFSASYFTKLYTARLRPNREESVATLARILQDPNSFSFFSGHASSSFAVTTFMVLLLQQHYRAIYLAYLWPLLFVVSRVYVGVHYPGDVLVGAMAGVAIALIMYRIYRYILKRRSITVSGSLHA